MKEREMQLKKGTLTNHSGNFYIFSVDVSGPMVIFLNCFIFFIS